MKLDVTARHFTLTPAIQEFVEKKVEGMEGLVKGEAKLHAILSVDKYVHSAELVFHADHLVRRAQASSKDLYDAVNKSVKKLERELVNYERKERETVIRKVRQTRSLGIPR